MENNQKEITPKICKQELLFLSMAYHLIVLYNVPSFIEISLTVSELSSGHEIVWKLIKGK